MAVERDLILTAQAFPDRVEFHWGEGLRIKDDKEKPLMLGSQVVIKNGSPETPLRAAIVSRFTTIDGNPYFYIDYVCHKSTDEPLKFAHQRAGIGRYEAANGKPYTAYDASLRPSGIARYLDTVDSCPKEVTH